MCKDGEDDPDCGGAEGGWSLASGVGTSGVDPNAEKSAAAHRALNVRTVFAIVCFPELLLVLITCSISVTLRVCASGYTAYRSL